MEEIEESTIENTVESVLLGHFAEDTGASLIRWEVDDTDKAMPEVFIHLPSPTDIDRNRMTALAEEISADLETSVKLTVTQIPSFTVTSAIAR